MLIAAVIATAVWDAMGQGMTGLNREGLVESAWLYLESTMFRQDLELVGLLPPRGLASRSLSVRPLLFALVP